ncbi:amino acid adenylation domain-containing protein [Streptomyces sp. NBC_00102]|uniref:non-ribosomal peptide synthetase n=1 Tax=Streptomyces sp. NBC_00102 TaxID=2975652 RepID=UPI0022573E8E|nr:amino acid adenylation domain-containing protein [Streptomyces sp. NBC_00102]MCX5395499.1 amino acid adenylation domain-containing protein [Streptomyces sp. NBC_00102]
MLGTHRPLSLSQERTWLLDRSDTDHVGHPCLTVEVEGPLDSVAVERALNACVGRHAFLRTSFEEVEGAPRQRTAPAGVSCALVLTDLRDRARADGAEEDLARLLDEDRRSPFEADRAPLVRARLVRIGEERHVLQVVLHALIADEESVAVLARDLSMAYADADRSLPPLPGGSEPSGQPHPTHDSPGSPAAEFRPGSSPAAPSPLVPRSDANEPVPGPVRAIPFRLEPDLADCLRGLARADGADLTDHLLAGVFLAAAPFAEPGRDVLLHCSVPADREPRTAIGPYTDELLLRLRIDPDESFRALVRHVAELRGAVEKHRADFPPTGPDTTDEDAGLFAGAGGIAFRMLPAPPLPHFEGARSRVPALAHRDPGARLTWTVETSTDEAPSGDVSRRSGAWSAETAAALADMWLRALRALAEDPDRPVGSLSLTPPEHLRRIAGWNRTARPQTGPPTIDGLFRDQVRERPAAVALQDGTGQWTYAELDRWSDSIAESLRTAGVAPDRPVGVQLHRSAAMVAAMLGVLKAGAGYLVLDPRYPTERLRLMAEDAGTAAVLYAGDPPGWPAASGIPAVALRSPGAVPAAGPGRHGDPDGLANIVFTSGSTGRPKGVAIPHKAVARLVRDTDYVSLGPEDVLVHLGDPSFDITTLEVWGALCNGARLVVLPGAEPLGPDEVIAAVRTHRPTVLCLTGMLFNRVVETDATAMAPLRFLFVVGEVMNPAVTRRLMEQGAPQHLLNGYGPSENTTFSACHLIRTPPKPLANIPIGTAITNTSLHVLDVGLHPLPIGAPGELYVGGQGLARGYAGRPELTAERFVPHPFPDMPGERLYRTGDLVRRLPTGELEFLGRVDDQVKIRGYRIEPGEIEAALAATGRVTESSVRVVDVSGDKRLVAYVVPQGPRSADPAVLRSELGTRLPAHLIPNHFVTLDALPVTSSGKLDARALPGLEAAEDRPAAATPPRNATERALWQIWSELLEIQGFGVHDDFFAIGGHSLLASRAVIAVRTQLGVDLGLRNFFDRPTIADLAPLVAAGPATAADSRLDALAAELSRLSGNDGDATHTREPQ